MIKEVPCMECDGKGFIAKFGEYSVWSERCPNCGGTGIVKVPVTNADRIRAMSDEELAQVFCNADWCNACGQLKQDGTCLAMEMGGPLDPYCKAGCLTWLRQPAGEAIR